MYELVQVGENTYYIQCPAKMGVYRVNDEEVYLIDSGNDKEAGKKVEKIFKEKGWSLKAIINTHSNADHIGGNKVLIDRTGCTAYSLGIERVFTENTILEPTFLYGGYPFKELRNKFLMAKESPSVDIKELQLPQGMEYIEIPGHYFDMIAIKTPDDIWFLGDCMSGENIIEKYHLSFIYDIRKYLETLELVSSLDGKLFIPSHADACENIELLANKNKAKVSEIIDVILRIIEEPLVFEDILERIFINYGLKMDFNQYVLIGSTVKSYLSYLSDEGKVEPEVIGAKLFWKKL